MADERDAPEEQTGKRDAEGRWVGPQPTSFRPGQSGNPGGLPKGYVKFNKRLSNYLGTDEGWERAKEKVDRLLDGDLDNELALRFLQFIAGNDSAIDRNKADGEGRIPPTVKVVIENQDTHEEEDEEKKP